MIILTLHFYISGTLLASHLLTKVTKKYIECHQEQLTVISPPKIKAKSWAMEIWKPMTPMAADFFQAYLYLGGTDGLYVCFYAIISTLTALI